MRSRIKQTKITKSARGENCALRVPGVCNHDNDTVQLCHAGKGTAKRNEDWWGVYGCKACHDWMDGNVQDPDRELYIKDAIHETQAKLIQKGLIVIS